LRENGQLSLAGGRSNLKITETGIIYCVSISDCTAELCVLGYFALLPASFASSRPATLRRSRRLLEVPFQNQVGRVYNKRAILETHQGTLVQLIKEINL